MGQSLKKDDGVFFNGMQVKGNAISAIVQRTHKDGTSTIQSCFSVDGAGDVIAGTWLGHKHRVSNSLLFADFADLPK